MDPTILNFSFDPGLDTALLGGWDRWFATAKKRGVERTTEWLMRRVESGLDPADAAELIGTLLESEALVERAMAASELAEYVEVDDDALAGTLWEGVLRAGRDANDSEIYFEGVSQLADIERDYGDLQAAAQLYADFLNWAREPGRSTEAEAIFTAFERLSELAEDDGQPAAAATFAHRQHRFFQSVDGDDRAIVSEDWEPGSSPYTIWTDGD